MTHGRDALALPQGANRKSRRQAGADRIAAGARRHEGRVATAKRFLQSLALRRRLGAADVWLAPRAFPDDLGGLPKAEDRQKSTTQPQFSPMPAAAGISVEGRGPGSRLRVNQQSPHKRDRRLRSRRSAGDRSFARCLAPGKRPRRSPLAISTAIRTDACHENIRTYSLRESSERRVREFRTFVKIQESGKHLTTTTPAP